MKNNILTSLALLILLQLIMSCDNILLDETEPNNPQNNFEYLWNDYDQLYGGFIVKNIDWDALYNIYMPQVSNNVTDTELYNVFTGLLDHLNDNHVFLLPTVSNLEPYSSGVIGKMKTFTDFKLSVIKNNYLSEYKSYNDAILYGKLKNNSGYLHISDFEEGEKTWKKALEKIIPYMKDTDKLIIDIRNNKGGTDQEALFVAGHFTNKSKKVLKVRLRSGPEHDDFTSPINFYVNPEGDKKYKNNIVLLTHRFTISAAETFTLALDRFDNVTIMGDTTSGAFSDVIRRELPNGWAYGVSIGDWRDHKDKSHEGIGFPPDILVQNKEEDINSGIDECLEKAIRQ